MLKMFSLDDIVKATHGILINEKRSIRLKGISINSRTLKRGDLFIAIQGQNFDGHDFIKDVIKKSAAAMVVSKKDVVGQVDIPVILVKDTLKALGDIALFHRLRFQIPVIAITGSAGKTTTKDLVTAVLKRKYRVHKNVANHNNLIGVPLTLFGLDRSHEILVIELGTNFPGEIKRLAEITRPTAAILTNIGESHLEFLKTSARVFKEKLQIVNHMDDQGMVIFNNDDFYLSKIPGLKLKPKLISYGIKQTCDYKADRVGFAKNAYIHFRLNKKKIFTLKSSALHMVYNALAAVSTARLLGIELSDVQKAFCRFSAMNNRYSLSKIGGYWIIDDSYNSNPVSLRSAIHSLNCLNSAGRKIFVCGDMLELGRSSDGLHHRMGRLIVDSDIDILLTVGRHSRFTAQAAKKNKKLKVHHFTSTVSAQNSLAKYLQPNDTILVKGSRGVHLEKIVEFIRLHRRPRTSARGGR